MRKRYILKRVSKNPDLVGDFRCRDMNEVKAVLKMSVETYGWNIKNHRLFEVVEKEIPLPKLG